MGLPGVSQGVPSSDDVEWGEPACLLRSHAKCLLCFALTAVATSFVVANSTNQTGPVITATANASSQAAAANTQATGSALAATAVQSVAQGVADIFAASQASQHVANGPVANSSE